ncbi:hypothetical protein [Streptomyces sp. NPDC058664]
MLDHSPSVGARRSSGEAAHSAPAAENLQFQVRLLAADAPLVALAVSAFDAVTPLRTASTRAELADREQDLLDALDAFVVAATPHVRWGARRQGAQGPLSEGCSRRGGTAAQAVPRGSARVSGGGSG